MKYRISAESSVRAREYLKRQRLEAILVEQTWLLWQARALLVFYTAVCALLGYHALFVPGEPPVWAMSVSVVVLVLTQVFEYLRSKRFNELSREFDRLSR